MGGFFIPHGGLLSILVIVTVSAQTQVRLISKKVVICQWLYPVAQTSLFYIVNA
jgi:hypothetical protein